MLGKFFKIYRKVNFFADDFRIEDYVKQLTEFDSLKTKIDSYEQLLHNEKAEREKLNNELILATQRANEVPLLDILFFE